MHIYTWLHATQSDTSSPARCPQAKADERGYHPARKWQHVEPMTIETNSICGAMKLHHTRTEAATAEQRSDPKPGPVGSVPKCRHLPVCASSRSMTSRAHSSTTNHVSPATTKNTKRAGRRPKVVASFREHATLPLVAPPPNTHAKRQAS